MPGFPAAAVINPGEFKLIFADGQTNLSTLSELHTSFALPAGAGSLALTRLASNALLQILDFVDYTNLLANYSYGSFPDGQSFYRQQFVNVTPRGANDATIVPSFIAYTTPGAVYVQDFDSLPNPGSTSVNSDNPVTINGATYSLPDPFDCALPPVTSGTNGGLGLTALSGWYGWGALASKLGATDGDQTTGGAVSFGAPRSTNRALGLLATSSTSATAFGARFINLTASTLNYMTLQLTGEVWRQSDKAKTLKFYYLIDPSGTRPFSTNITAFLPALDVSFPAVPADVGGLAVDGTSALNQTNLGVVNLPITNWPPAAALWLVWEMTDSASKAQGLAIDNLSFSASSGNLPPVLTPVPDQPVYANTPLTFTASATEGDLPPETLMFSLGAGAPAGASITPGGVFTWTPTAAQAPSTNLMSVIVTDSGVPAMSATNGFKVMVSQPNTAPAMAAITNQAVYANTLLSFTVSATDTDQPPQTLTFTLDSGAPTGASITPGGLFTWTPTETQAPSTNIITVTVTDNGMPPLSGTNTFLLFVMQAMRITDVSRVGNAVTLTWNSQAGQTCRVLYKNSLTETRWQQLGQDILAGGPTTSVTDTIRSGLAAFYRVEFVR
jgi:hypothetical protein